MINPNYIKKDDFLTSMINDEVFKNNDSILIDECITVLTGGTQTTVILVSNAIMNLTIEKACHKKMKEELLKFNKELEGKSLNSLNLEEWKHVMNFEKMGDYSYLTAITSETLRLDPSVKIPSVFVLTEACTIKDIKIKAN